MKCDKDFVTEKACLEDSSYEMKTREFSLNEKLFQKEESD